MPTIIKASATVVKLLSTLFWGTVTWIIVTGLAPYWFTDFFKYDLLRKDFPKLTDVSNAKGRGKFEYFFIATSESYAIAFTSKQQSESFQQPLGEQCAEAAQIQSCKEEIVKWFPNEADIILRSKTYMRRVEPGAAYRMRLLFSDMVTNRHYFFFSEECSGCTG